MSLIVQTNLTGVTDNGNALLTALAALLRAQIPGVPNVYASLTTIGDSAIAFPCFLIDVKRFNPQMLTTGKYQTPFECDIYWYIGDGDFQNAKAKAICVGSILSKLFGNNAANNQNGQYKQYLPYWANSEQGAVEVGPPLQFDEQAGRPKYVCVGVMPFKALVYGVL